jgi:hypothetical protein
MRGLFVHLFNDEARTGGSTSVRGKGGGYTYNYRTGGSTSIRPGRTGNPISGGWARKTVTWGERTRGFLYSKLLKMLKNPISKFDPITLRIVPDRFGVFLLAMSPYDMGCGTMQCAINDGLIESNIVTIDWDSLYIKEDK